MSKEASTARTDGGVGVLGSLPLLVDFLQLVVKLDLPQQVAYPTNVRGEFLILLDESFAKRYTG